MSFKKTTDANETEEGFATVRKGVGDGYISSQATPRRSPRSRNGLVVVPQVQCVMIHGQPITAVNEAIVDQVQQG